MSRFFPCSLACLALLAGPAAACEAPLPAQADIAAERFYTDAAQSVPDPEAQARNKASLKDIDAFIVTVVGLSNKALAASDRAAGACAATWLAAWAKDGALLGRMSSNQAEYERKWRLSAFAFAYIKVKADTSPAQRIAIEPWLDRLADRAEIFFDDRRHKRNNHYYWVGLAAGAVAPATGNVRHWTYASMVYDDALHDIARDGTLPLELNRGGKALHYHNFALAPLVMLAELAARRGEDWYTREGGALHRLAATTLAGIANPEDFSRRAGKANEVPKGGIVGWVAFYGRRFPNRVADPGILARRYGNAWLGGDLTALAEAWIKRAQPL